MIVNFSIQNFGCIKHKQTLSFEATNSNDLEKYFIIEPIKGLRLLKLGLIYGANASGKTTVLKALEFLRSIVLQPAEKKTEHLNFEPFLFDDKTPLLNTILAIEFIENSIRFHYEVEFNKQAIVREALYFFNPNKAKIFSRKTDIENQFTEIDFGNKVKKDKIFEKNLEANTLWNNTVLGGFLKTNIEFPELKHVVSWFTNYLNPLIKAGTKLDSFVTSRINANQIDKRNVIEILKKADFNISDILIQVEEEKMPNDILEFLKKQGISIGEEAGTKNGENFSTFKLELQHTVNSTTYKLPFNLESEGTKRYYGFSGLLSIILQKPAFFLIDELESSLHPDLFTHFVLSFLVNSSKSQILATTHNREILNNKDIFRNDAIWFTDKSKDCATELYALSDFDSKVIRDTSNVYNAYKIGKLGAVPALGDYYIDLIDEKK